MTLPIRLFRLLFRSFLVVLCLWFVALMSVTPASAAVSCKEWNTWSFFSDAGAADVSRCIGAGAEVNARDKYGNTPLRKAAEHNENPAVITALVKAGAKVNAKDKYGNTPLHMAASENKNPAVITALLKAGADVIAKNKSGETPLQSAMESKKKIPAVINAMKRASERNRGRKAERRRQAKSCAKWNTEAFFEYADAADVSRCLKMKSANARNEQGETPLHKAVVYSKKTAVVTALLEVGAGVNAKDAYGNTPLHEAVRYNENPAVITTLLKAGADVNARTPTTEFGGGETPLHFAARNENPAVITALLKAGAKVNARTFKAKYGGGETPLHFAARNENPAVITTLLKAGADVNARTPTTEFGGGETPLHFAARNENPAVITALLKAGAKVNARTFKAKYGGGETPLHFAARNENPAVITALLKAGADVNARTPTTEFGGGETPLHKAAARNENPAVITALLKAGAKVNARTFKAKYGGGETPLHKAAKNNENPAVITTLLKAGADVNAKDTQGKTPLRKAAEHNKNPAVITALLKAGAEINARSLKQESTPLHWAASENKNPAVITALVKAGAKVNAKDKYGATPLHKAANNNENPAVITALVKAGAKVNAKDKYGATPLHKAANNNENPAVITALVKAGADLNARTHSYRISAGRLGVAVTGKEIFFPRGGETPLHLAAHPYTYNPAVITALVAAGADPNTRNKSGDTPLGIAKKYERIRPAHVLAFSAEAVAAFRKKERKVRAAERKREMEQRLRAERISCGKWNTSAFFKHAGAADVSRCLKRGGSPNARNRYDETPLHMAAKFGKTPAVVAALKKAGVDLNARDKKGRTPLHTAAVFGKTPAVVAALIKAGADLNAKDKRGRTPLQYAVKFSKTPAIVAVLKKASGLPKKTRVVARKREVELRPGTARVSCEKWNTPAFFSSMGFVDLTRCLKLKDPNARNKFGRTPLHYAAQGETPALVSALVKAGAKVNARDERGGWTPLHLAAWFGKTPAVVAALVDAGANLGARDKKGKTPWDYAEQNAALKNTDVFSRLNEEQVETGARPSGAAQVSCEKWNTPAFFKSAGLADIARCLKVKKPDARNKYGRTPLHYAAQGETPALVSALVKAGADPNARDTRGGWTPLHLAAQTGKTPAVVTALIKAGADPAAKDKKGRTPLGFAEKFNKTPALVSALKQARDSCERWNTAAFFKNADLADLSRCLKVKKPDARDEKGRTPLHLAAWLGKTPAVVTALMDAGADPAARDKQGKTPWDYAEQNAALKDTAPYWRLNEERFR